ncbi:MAG: hypothetical protein DRP65_04215 [Planctomycetota bacterium]|nr:MAG: hypothetical protein DRP65_04215 [Planctomycetota bacterium]
MAKILDELVDFAVKYHRGFEVAGKERAKIFLETVAATTIVYQERGKILGFAIYFERNDKIVFFCIAVKKELEQNWRAIPIFMKVIEKLPCKPIYYIGNDLELKLLKWQKPSQLN